MSEAIVHMRIDCFDPRKFWEACTGIGTDCGIDYGDAQVSLAQPFYDKLCAYLRHTGPDGFHVEGVKILRKPADA